MEVCIKELKGHSGSKIYLMQDMNKIFVRKLNNVDRNYERLAALKNIISIPQIYSKNDNILDMEYIHGLDMKNYLTYNNSQKITHFLLESINKLSKNSFDYDYTEVYRKKLSFVDWSLLTFSMNDLITRLPKILPRSLYHGDMTLENIIYDTKNDKFTFIDPLTSEYDSYVFDLAKLNQDLRCKWFIRNNKVKINDKLISIYNNLSATYKCVLNDNLIILMLLRVLPYCNEKKDKEFILREVHKLWM